MRQKECFLIQCFNATAQSYGVLGPFCVCCICFAACVIQPFLTAKVLLVSVFIATFAENTNSTEK